MTLRAPVGANKFDLIAQAGCLPPSTNLKVSLIKTGPADWAQSLSLFHLLHLLSFVWPPLAKSVLLYKRKYFGLTIFCYKSFYSYEHLASYSCVQLMLSPYYSTLISRTAMSRHWGIVMLPPLPRPPFTPLHAIFVAATKLSWSDWYGTINHVKEHLAKSAVHKQWNGNFNTHLCNCKPASNPDAWLMTSFPTYTLPRVIYLQPSQRLVWCSNPNPKVTLLVPAAAMY